MILALNIGNSNITFGSYTPDGKLVFSSRLFADTALSSDELLYKMVNMLALYGAEPQEITAIIFSSVVPPMNFMMEKALTRLPWFLTLSKPLLPAMSTYFLLTLPDGCIIKPI